jgi:hypothetical protein
MSGPADRRTGLAFAAQCRWCIWRVEADSNTSVALMLAQHEARHPTNPECGTRAPGRMVCQLRRGHDGAHEDWSQV